MCNYDKEIILSKIAEIMSREYFIVKTNSTFKSILKCIGLQEYFNKYSRYLVPYYYIDGYNQKFENDNSEYDVFLGLDSIFSDLYHKNRIDDIIRLLKELTKSFNIRYIIENMTNDFEELANLYELLGLNINIEYDKVLVSTCMVTNIERVNEVFSVEEWLKQVHKDVYDSYKSAIDAYIQGHAGLCIESCRTCIVSIFSKYKGTENFAKWIRGVYNISGDNTIASKEEMTQAISKEVRKEDLADFFYENRAGKLTKTKTIYMIYSMMSDYGTHRNESTNETPMIEDALFSLRLTDSILFWVYSKKHNIH